jgi:hypothetical protein
VESAGATDSDQVIYPCVANAAANSESAKNFLVAEYGRGDLRLNCLRRFSWEYALCGYPIVNLLEISGLPSNEG